MTWASYEFKRIVKEKQKIKLSTNIKVVFGITLAASLIYLVASFLYVYNKVCNNQYTLLIMLLCLATIGVALLYLKWKQANQDPSQIYKTQIRNGIIAEIKQAMAQSQLPLDQAGEAIRQDIQKKLDQTQKENHQYVDFIKKICAGIVWTPSAFLLALLFQGFFSKEILSTAENINDAIDFLLQLFILLVLIAVIIVILYGPVGDIMNYMTGENRLRDCLDILEEIRIGELCASSTPVENPLSVSSVNEEVRTEEAMVERVR